MLSAIVCIVHWHVACSAFSKSVTQTQILRSHLSMIVCLYLFSYQNRSVCPSLSGTFFVTVLFPWNRYRSLHIHSYSAHRVRNFRDQQTIKEQRRRKVCDLKNSRTCKMNLVYICCEPYRRRTLICPCISSDVSQYVRKLRRERTLHWNWFLSNKCLHQKVIDFFSCSCWISTGWGSANDHLFIWVPQIRDILYALHLTFMYLFLLWKEVRSLVAWK